ncbi:hypothetical protein O3P69_017182 [Scylla paramamosain]|uniref:Cytochrome P450 n=2 Tax=Scylla paramamosain TaxID=85552 RepID=A0AAW0TUQ3_SCYPA
MLVEVVLFAVFLFLLLQVLKKPANYPPGRWGLPLVGYVPLPGPTIQDHFRNLHKKHGNIYLWRIGTQVMVFVNDFRLLREAFNRQEFTERPDWMLYKTNENIALGVVSSNNLIWHNNRRFSLRQLRDLGMGKSKLVEAVQTRAMWLVDRFSKRVGNGTPIALPIKIAITNVIWQLVGGKQFEEDDPKMTEFDAIFKEFLDSETLYAIQDFLPWVRYLMPAFLFKRLTKEHVVINTLDRFLKFFYEEIDEHRATLIPGEPRDLIDGYLMEMEGKKDDPDTTFNRKDLAFLVMDLFLAGSETTSSTLTWMLYYLSTNPHIQRKLQVELDAVIPEGYQATLEDKPRLPYCEAVIHETLRKSSLVATGVHHVASRDTTLGGYTIPKGAVLNTATLTIHHDPRYWDKPEEFMPERWLDQDGKFVSKKEGFVPFGVGKRQCLGESLARMELLIFTSTLLHRLSFAPLPGKTLDLKPDPSNPFLHLPVPQELHVTVRT